MKLRDIAEIFVALLIMLIILCITGIIAVEHALSGSVLYVFGLIKGFKKGRE
jgi:cytochrome b